MSEIIIDWLNREIQLSKHIYTIEDDFKNAFFFGELLYKLNYIEDVSQYAKSKIPKVVAGNFQATIQSLKELNVKFDPDSFAKGKLEEMLKVLFSLKQLYDKGQDFRKLALGKTKIKETKSLIQGTKSGYTKMSKYEQKGNEYEDKVKSEHEKIILKNMQTVQEMRKEEMDTMKKNKEFINEWNNKGLQTFSVNQARLKEIKQQEKEFRHSELEKYRRQIKIMEEKGNKEQKEGIEDYIKNLERLGIDINAITDQEKKVKKQEFSVYSTLERIRGKNEINEAAKKLKDQRLVKMKHQEEEKQKEIENQQIMGNFLKSVNEKSKKCQDDAYNHFRGRQIKDILIYQEKETQFTSKKILDDKMETLYNQHLELRKQNKKIKNDEINKARRNIRNLEMEHKLKKRKLHSKVCINIINSILDVMHEAYKDTISQKITTIDNKKWAKWIQLFMDNKNIEEIEEVTIDEPSDNAQISLSKEQENWNFVANKSEGLDFLFQMGQWHHIIMKEKINKIKENIEKNAESLEINSTFFDKPPQPSLLHEVYEKCKHIDQIPSTTINNNIILPNYLPIKMAIIGRKFSKYKSIAKSIAKKRNLYIIDPKKIIKKILNNIEVEKQQEEEKKTAKSHVKKSSKKEVEVEFDKIEGVIDSREIREIVIKINTEEKNKEPLICELLILYINTLFKSPEEEWWNNLRESVKRKLEIEAELKALSEETTSVKGKPKSQPKKIIELENELKNLKIPKEIGFIIVGFPKNAEQMRLFLEKTNTFIKKGEYDNMYSVKTSTAVVPKIILNRTEQSSYLDALIHLLPTKEEAMRRSRSLMQDPESSIIYIKEFQEPENEEIKKNLTEFSYNPEKAQQLEGLMISYDNILKEVHEQIELIGNKAKNTKLLEIVNGNCLFLECESRVDKIIETHNSIFNKIIEDIQRALIEEKQRLEDNENIEQEEEEEEQEKINSNEKDIQPESKKVEEATTLIPDNKEKPNQTNAKLNPEHLKTIEELWIKCQEDFEFFYKISFEFQRTQRKKIVNNLIGVQAKFVDFLQRKDNRIQDYLNEHLDEMRQFITQKQGLKLKENVQEILEKSSTLSYGLWKVLEKKKDENLEEYQNITSSKSLNYEIRQDIKKVQGFLQSIVSRFIQISQIIICFAFYSKGMELPQINEDFFIAVDYTTLNEEPISTVDTMVKSSIDYIRNSLFKSILPKESSNLELFIESLEREKAISIYFIELVKYWAIIMICENIEQYKKVSEKLDDLIVIAVKDENDLLQKTMSEIKSDLSMEFKLKNEYKIEALSLAKYISIDYIKYPIQDLFVETFPKSFSKNQLQNLKIVFKAMTSSEQIDIERFYEILLFEIKSSEIPEVYSQIPSNRVFNNYEVNNEKKINWVKYLIMISLGNYFIPNKNSLFEWRNELVKKQTTFKEINCNDFICSKTWIDKTSVDENKNQAEEKSNEGISDLREKLEFISDLLKNIDNSISIEKAIEMMKINWKEEDIEGRIYWDYLFDIKKID